VFTPQSGEPGDTVETSGCSWVENNEVTLEWGYPDTNNQPIIWNASVDSNTGCFNREIAVPLNTITGPIDVTATGDNSGEVTTTFTVTHGGLIDIPLQDIEIGDMVTVEVSGGIVGESISFYWDDGSYLGAAGVVQPNFSVELEIPISAAAGSRQIRAVGSKGFDDTADVFVLDNSTLSVTSNEPHYVDSSIEIEGTNWAAGEAVSFGLRADDLSFYPFDPTETIVVDEDKTTFAGKLDFPESLPGGDYTLEASGDKGRDAEVLNITLVEPPPPAFSLDVNYADPAPVLDGILRTGEWDYFDRVTLNNGFLSASSDDTRLYLLLDILTDTGEDVPGDDNFWITVDILGNRQIDSGKDLNFTLDGNGELILQEYTGPGSLINRSVGFRRSAVANGFGCFSGDNTLTFSISNFNCDEHRIYELGIDLSTIDAEPGDTIRLGVRIESPSPVIDESLPLGFESDFTNLGEITLAPSRLDPVPPAGIVSDIGSNGFTLEITQATQDVDNSLKLVSDKDTAVRVYPKVDAEARVRVYLYGEKGGQDLPGSPLVTLATIPSEIDRASLNDTANFLLPSSWTSHGFTNFTAMAENPHLFNSVAAIDSVFFYEQSAPIIWTLDINEGTNANPILPDPVAVSRQEDMLETLLPIPDVRWIERSWTELGATGAITTGVAKGGLKDYYWDLEAAWAMGVIPPEQPPDILYGHLPSCDPDGTIGTSDPIWSGGQGIVAVGCPSNSKRANMAHEVNHNLDRRKRVNATWGRHVGGCGAEQGDSNWPWLTGTMTTTINEVGFDLRLPWDDGQAGPNVNVFTTDWPEFMSYCRTSVAKQPTQWISAYRWDEMFPTFGSLAAADVQRTLTTTQTVFYLSGQVNRDGSGTLNAVKKQAGFPTELISPGDYSLELQTDEGVTLESIPFFVSFTSVELKELNSVPFSYNISAHPDAEKIVLKHGEDILDSVMASDNPPAVTVTSPTGGENWNSMETITWDSGDLDGDNLTFAVYYSPDEGGQWMPIASGLEEERYVVDADSLPGGTGGKIRVIANDGFHSTTADSNSTFTVPPSAPLVTINNPIDEDTYPSNVSIDLAGSATDLLASSFPEENFIWSLDGQPFDVGSESSLILSPGQYTITLSVSDGQGNVGEDSVTITVELADVVSQVYLPAIFR
jgi:hypothetical protein